MLIDYKLLGNEALLLMKFFLQQWFRVSMKLCNVVNCILRIKCSLNLLVSYVCFDINFVVAFKGLHCADIVCECNSLKNFALYVINKKIANN